jgi:hypothetical protein
MKRMILEDASEDVQNLIANVTNYESFVAKLGEFAKDPKVQAFLKSGRGDGDGDDDKFTATEKSIAVVDLRPTQNEIGVEGSLKWPLTKPDSLKNCLEKGTRTIKAPVVTYDGQYIIDGHHRWSQLYSMNKDAQISCIDLSGPKMNPIDVLKVVQLAIAADAGTVHTVSASGDNLLELDGKAVAKYTIDVISNDCIKVFNSFLGTKLGKLDKNNIAGKIVVPNVMEMQETSQPVPGAPKRDVMPQTDKAPDAVKMIAKGVVNFNKPYTAEHYQKKIHDTLNNNKMKKSELKQIIKEEYQKMNKNNKSILTEESIITKILYLFLSPKVKRDIKKVKNSPEWIELERQAKLAASELEAINKRLERAYKDQDTNIKSMQKAGIKITADMSPKEKLKAYQDWENKQNVKVGLPINKDWDKYLS